MLEGLLGVHLVMDVLEGIGVDQNKSGGVVRAISNQDQFIKVMVNYLTQTHCCFHRHWILRQFRPKRSI